MIDLTKEQNGEQKEDDDHQLLFTEEGRRAQEELVGTGQAEKLQAMPPPKPSKPPPLPLPYATEAGMEED